MLAVGHLVWDRQGTLLAGTHVEETFVPAADDLAETEVEVEGLAAVDGAVEFSAVEEGAGVVHVDDVALAGLAFCVGVSIAFLGGGRGSEWGQLVFERLRGRGGLSIERDQVISLVDSRGTNRS